MTTAQLPCVSCMSVHVKLEIASVFDGKKAKNNQFSNGRPLQSQFLVAIWENHGKTKFQP